MRTLIAGIEAFQRAPRALAPMAIEGALAAILILFGLLPADAGTAPSVAAFPLDIYFDLKHWLSHTSSWPKLILVTGVAVMIRAAVLASTLWLSEDGRGSFSGAWQRCIRLATIGLALLLPVAVLHHAGAAVRYAPFNWLAAPIGLAIALLIARRAVAIDTGSGPAGSGALPELPGFLSYVFFLCASGAVISALVDVARILGALVVLCLAPLHALVLLGWRENARRETYPGGGSLAIAFTVVLVAAIAFGTIYDRFVRTAPPVAEASGSGRLLLLGGVDSSSATGALVELDTRTVGYPAGRVTLLSYSGNQTYGPADTRADLDDVAVRVAEQINDVRTSTRLLGHSQASLILDRILDARPSTGDARSSTPDAAAVLAPAPPFPPGVTVPAPGRVAPGKPAGDLTRAFARLLDVIGLQPFDVDDPASPTNLDPVVVLDEEAPRLSVWALADSVWLDRDWRRPGELNVVAVTDHVGVTNNARALDAVKRFFDGSIVESDETNWRGALVPVVRYAFEPWRP